MLLAVGQTEIVHFNFSVSFFPPTELRFGFGFCSSFLYSVWQVRFISFFSSTISEFVWQTRNSRRSPQVCIVWKTDPIWILSLFVKCTRNYLFFAQCTSKFTRAEYWIKRSVLRYRYQTEAGSARKGAGGSNISELVSRCGGWISISPKTADQMDI